MNWFTILKIKDSTGEDLRMIDYDQLVVKLRAKLRSKVAQHHPTRTGEGPTGRRQEISRINMNRTRGVTRGRLLTFKISGLNAGTKTRYQYEFTCYENDDGDYVYRMVIGPGIQYGVDTVVADEDTLINNIAEIIGEEHSTPEREPSDARQIQEEMIDEHDDHKLYVAEFKDMEQRKVDYAEEQGNDKLLPDYSKSWTQRYNVYLQNIGRSDLVR